MGALKIISKGIPTRKEIAKFFDNEGMQKEVFWADKENQITQRHNEALIFHAQMQERQIKVLEESLTKTIEDNHSIADSHDKLQLKLDDAEQQIKKLKEYAEHKPSCRINKEELSDLPYYCTCGFYKLLNKH